MSTSASAATAVAARLATSSDLAPMPSEGPHSHRSEFEVIPQNLK